MDLEHCGEHQIMNNMNIKINNKVLNISLIFIIYKLGHYGEHQIYHNIDIRIISLILSILKNKAYI